MLLSRVILIINHINTSYKYIIYPEKVREYVRSDNNIHYAKNDWVYTIPEVADILKTSEEYVIKLQEKGFLTFIKLGELKCRKSTLEAFLEKYDGYDLTDLDNIKKIKAYKEED